MDYIKRVMELEDAWRVVAITSLAVIVLTLSIANSFIMAANGGHSQHAASHERMN